MVSLNEHRIRAAEATLSDATRRYQAGVGEGLPLVQLEPLRVAYVAAKQNYDDADDIIRKALGI